MSTRPMDMVRVYATAFGVDPDKLAHTVNEFEAHDALSLQSCREDELDSLALAELADRLEADR